MQVSIGLVAGILIGVLLVTLSARATASTCGWITLGFGLVTAAALTGGLMPGARLLLPASISLSVATVIMAVTSLVRGRRHWAVWVGMVLGLLGAGFWLFFIAGELLYPH